MIIAPFHPAHMLEIRAQPNQPKDSKLFADPEYGQCLASGEAFTVLDGNTVQACLGVFEMTEGRALAWALLGEDCGRVMVRLHKQVRAYLEQCPFHRVEAYVDPNFPAAIRWMRLLGFEFEGRMRQFLPNRADQLLYARTK